MTIFRPCIDLHEGKVKQIVGASLSDSNSSLRTNFESNFSAAHYAELYKRDSLRGGHVIMLGKGNEPAAKEALAAYPHGLQVGGSITPDNAKIYLDEGASHVIVTSFIFDDQELSISKLEKMFQTVGKKNLVLDLSCKRISQEGETPKWFIATNRWQNLTHVEISPKTLEFLSKFCDEFLIHAADVEGLQNGMDEALIAFLAKECPIPATYAGGARSLEDLFRCKEISDGKIDLTIGSALDIFGGGGVRYAECIAFNQSQR